MFEIIIPTKDFIFWLDSFEGNSTPSHLLRGEEFISSYSFSSCEWLSICYSVFFLVLTSRIGCSVELMEHRYVFLPWLIVMSFLLFKSVNIMKEIKSFLTCSFLCRSISLPLACDCSFSNCTCMDLDICYLFWWGIFWRNIASPDIYL